MATEVKTEREKLHEALHQYLKNNKKRLKYTQLAEMCGFSSVRITTLGNNPNYNISEKYTRAIAKALPEFLGNAIGGEPVLVKLTKDVWVQPDGKIIFL